MNEQQDIRLKGRLKLYLFWPAIVSIILIGMTVWIYRVDKKAGMIMLFFAAIYSVVVAVLYFRNKSAIMQELVEFATQYGTVQNTLLKDLLVPCTILLRDGTILWMNEGFEEILGDNYSRETKISRYIPDIRKNIFPSDREQDVSMEVQYEEREYLAQMRCVPIEDFCESSQLLDIPQGQQYLISLYLEDITDLNVAIRANEEKRLVAGLIYIDNYDEVIGGVEEVRQSLLVALIDRKINQYFSKADAIVRKVETDKYFVILQKKYFGLLEDNRFSLLEDVKSVNVGNRIPPTLSIGFGLGRDDYSQSYNYARVAIDQALARGGDQVVIKDGDGITYYGGKREMTAKNTRVKARVKAEALREYMLTKENILVMGHQRADVDSLGAAVGIYRAAAAIGKRAHIVLNTPTASIRALYDAFRKDNAYPEDMFVDFVEAKELAGDNAMVIVVDTNRPQMTEYPDLLRMVKTIVVLDHHRQGKDSIDKATLSYIEPYASSACEMVCEILQYIVEDVDLKALEASSLYAGIMIDTNNFTNRTGVRTFEAAAFLRRNGADIPFVRKIFRDDMESYRAKASIITSAEVYHKQFAIARGVNLKIDNPIIIGAQAANELLDIDKIRASFVLTVSGGRIYVSARSIDEINVQIIMERLGGGGHMNSAGAQFEHTDIDLAVDSVKRQIDRMIQEGDI